MDSNSSLTKLQTMTTPAPDFCALLADDAYAASFQSLGQYRTALLKALATPPQEPPTDEAWQEFIEQVQRAQHVASREGESPRFDLVECALALWREAIPPVPEPEPPTDEELIRVAEESNFVYNNNGRWFNAYQEDTDIKTEVLSFARAVLERWG